MTDIQLIHGSDDFYPVQRTRSWGTLDRIDRHIFFLSTGKNSCSDIAYLLKMQRKDVRNRLCLLRLLGYVYLHQDRQYTINVPLVVQSLEHLQPYHKLCVQHFYDALCQELPALHHYFLRYHITVEQLESEFVIFLRFLVRAIQMNDQKTEVMFDSIIQGYHLCLVSEEQFTLVIRCFLGTLQYCLQDKWTESLETSWKRLCFVVEYAIFAKCQQI